MSPSQTSAPSGQLPSWQRGQLQQALGMPGHALLLHGPSGLGQYELALALAQAWLCEASDRGLQDAACGTCESCQQIQARGHTDLVVLMPEAMMIELGWPLTEKAQKDIDDKKRKPSQEIRIESVRDAVAFSELTSGRGRAKVILVYPADAMNHASANALLKTLEEPAGQLRFVLATHAADALLPTIRSRCQAVAVRQPSPDEAQAWLGTQLAELSEAQYLLALKASGGRPIDAIKLASSGALAAWPELPRNIQKGQWSAFAGWTAAQVLDALFKLCHDLWAIKLGAPPRFFDEADLPKAPPARALAAWGEQLKNVARVIDHPFKQDLLLEDMLQQAKVCINSRV